MNRLVWLKWFAHLALGVIKWIDQRFDDLFPDGDRFTATGELTALVQRDYDFAFIEAMRALTT